MKRFIVFLILSCPPIVFAETNYFVSTTGSNSNNGLTPATALKTITYACTIAQHGDTVNVMTGIYANTTYGVWDVWKSEQTVKINNKNSTSGNYLVIRPYNQLPVKIKGDGDFIFQIRNSSYIRVEGFEIEGEVNNIPLDTALKYQFVYRQCLNTACTSYIDTFRVAFGTPPSVIQTMTFPTLNNIVRPTTINSAGLLVQGSHHIDVVGNIIHHNTGAGLRFFECDYINCIGNEIHNNSRRSSVGTHGLVFHSSSSIDSSNDNKILISRNHVYRNYNEVFSWSEKKTIITPYIDEGKGISMQKNTVANGWLHGKIRIDNNITHHNGFSGIHINEGIRVDIINNTAFNNSYSYDRHGNNLGISVQEGIDIGIFNNISKAIPAGFAISASNSSNLTVSHNLVDGIIDGNISAIATNTISSNPLFVDTITFKLQSGSAAINAALISAAPVIDYYGLTRDQNPDIGAAEYFAALSTNDVVVKDNIALYPNPTNGQIFIQGTTPKQIRIFNILGEEVTNTIDIRWTIGTTIVNLKALGVGVYIIKTDDQILKVIKK